MAPIPEHRVPSREPLELNLRHLLAQADSTPPNALPLRVIADRVTRMLREAGDHDAAMEVTYNLIFRLLSTVGAHVNIWILDSYIVGRDRHLFRVGDRSLAPALGEVVEASVIILTAFLALQVLSQEAEASQLPMATTIWQSAVSRLPSTPHTEELSNDT